MVEDLGSTNGTFHNGSKLVGSKLLHPGDRVQAGTIVIEAQ
jgi:pSer/pThr/pTyr-binding forkhead associated (FHA) protein